MAARPDALTAPGAANRLAFVVAALLLAAAALLAPGCLPDDEEASADSGPLKEKLTLGSDAGAQTFTLEVARDDASREKGLSGRSGIAADEGMIFIFPNSDVRWFWMLDCPMDLDIIFVDPLGYVTAVHTMPAEAPRQPNESLDAYRSRLKRYSSVSKAQFAIELVAGKAKELGIKPNDRIDAEWARLKKLAR